MGRWAIHQRITAAATVLLLIALFLPWYTASVFGISASEDSVGPHGWMWFSFVICLLIVSLLVAQAGFESFPAALPSARPVLLSLAGLNLLLVLIAFFDKPSDGLVQVSWGFGAYLGLLCALAAAGAVGLPYGQQGATG